MFKHQYYDKACLHVRINEKYLCMYTHIYIMHTIKSAQKHKYGRGQC